MKITTDQCQYSYCIKSLKKIVNDQLYQYLRSNSYVNKLQ